MWNSKTTTTHPSKETKREAKEYIFVFQTPDGRTCQTQSEVKEAKRSGFHIELWDVFLACVVVGRFLGHLCHVYKKRM